MYNHTNDLWIPIIFQNKYGEFISHHHTGLAAIPLIALKYSEIPIKVTYLLWYYPKNLLLEK